MNKNQAMKMLCGRKSVRCACVELVVVCGCALSGLGALQVTADKVEVVIAVDAPKTVAFAAQEATNFLSRVLGGPVPVVSAPTADKVSLILGDNVWARAAGIDVAKFPRDGFAIRTNGRQVLIAGRDNPTVDLPRSVKFGWVRNMSERATLFGVYEFLERFAGCRFFFPGEFGEIVPRLVCIEIPETDLVRAPHFTARDPYMSGDGVWYEAESGLNAVSSRGKALSWLRLRMQTESIPCCHGQNGFKIRERFAKTNPEYFQLRKDGSRCLDAPEPGKPGCLYGHLCQSSKVWDVFYEDVKAYLTGQDADVRGIPDGETGVKCAWGNGFSGRRYVDVMPQDGYAECFCPACQKAYDKSTKHYARDLVWGRTAKLAQRLKDDGVSGVVSQMSYSPYGEVPSFDLPDNVLVTVAQMGPWGVRNQACFDAQIALFKAWSDKTHRRVRTWTYSHKYRGSMISGVPCLAPRATGAFWKRAAPYVCGGFLESESDRSFFQLFNYYVFSRIAWDPETDVDALIADHHAKMFGKGAVAMTEFYDLLEGLWLDGIVGDVRDTNVGPLVFPPNEHIVWTKVYTFAVLSRLSELCDRAADAAGASTPEGRRIAFIRRQYLDPLKASSAAYFEKVSVAHGLRERAGRPNRTLLKNGDFDEGLSDWQTSAGGAVAFDETTKVTGRGSVRLSSAERAEVKQYLGDDFRPGRKYRVSFFVKTEDIRPVKGSNGGVYVEFFDGGWKFFPKSDYRGTMDWVYQEWEITSGKAKPGDRPFVHLLKTGVNGMAWFDDIRVEPVEP